MATKKQTKADRRAAAQEQAAALRKAQQAKERRTRTLIAVGALALVALIAIAAVIIAQAAAKDPMDKVARPANTDLQGGAWITTDGNVAALDKDGNNPAAKGVVMDVYYDYMCHFCIGFEAMYAKQIDELRKDGSISLVLHPMITLGRDSAGNYLPGSGSAKSGEVAAETIDLDPAHFYAMHEAMISWQYDKMGSPADLEAVGNSQPSEFTAADFTQLAQQAGVSAEAQNAFSSDKYYDWLKQSSNTALNTRPQIKGTPAVYLRKAGQPFKDAKVWQPSYSDTSDLKTAVADVAAGKTPPPRSTSTAIPVPDTTPSVSVGK